MKSVSIETEGVSRAEIQALVDAAAARAVAAAQAATQTSTPGLAATLWRLIREIPDVVTALVGLASNGLIARTGAGALATRSVVGTAPISVTNGDGVSGNPTVALGDIAGVSAYGRAANSTGAPAAITAGANDTVLRRTADALSFGQLTVGMAPNDLWTYAKIQNVSVNGRVLGRISSGAGDIEELSPTELASVLSGSNLIGISQDATNGYVDINRGGTTQPGYVAFFTADGTRRGYIGWNNGSNQLQIFAEAGWTWDFSGAGGGITTPSGTYTPTLSAVTNIASVTSDVCQYIEADTVVTVSGAVSVTTTTSGTSRFRVSLPIASNFAATRQCAGVGISTSLVPAHIEADITNNEAVFFFNAPSGTSFGFTFTFTYLVV
jgi:hypothetical protein